jgi:hypothetical protein
MMFTFLLRNKGFVGEALKEYLDRRSETLGIHRGYVVRRGENILILDCDMFACISGLHLREALWIYNEKVLRALKWQKSGHSPEKRMKWTDSKMKAKII